MKWTINGANREDGSDVTLVIDAESEADAIVRSNGHGVLVSAVVAVSPDTSHSVAAARTAGVQTDRVACPTCAELVSTNASVCPFCRCPIFSRDRGANTVIAIAGSIVLFL